MRYVAVKLRTLIIGRCNRVSLSEGLVHISPFACNLLDGVTVLLTFLSRTLPIQLVLDLVLQFKFKFCLVTANFYCVLVSAVPRYTTRNYDAANSVFCPFTTRITLYRLKSYFPRTLRFWNSLAHSIKQLLLVLDSLKIFYMLTGYKTRLSSYRQP